MSGLPTTGGVAADPPLRGMAPASLRAVLGQLSPAGERGRLSVLIFHRVLAEPDPIFPGELCARRFDERLGWLGQLFNLLPLDEAIARLDQSILPARAAAVTFDDGYADNFALAAPILSRHRVPATFFIASGFLDGGCMWNDAVIESVRQASGPLLDLDSLGLGSHPIQSAAERYACIDSLLGRLKYLPPAERVERVDAIRARVGARIADDLMMTSDQVRALARQGFAIGAHTVSHPILARLAPADAKREMAGGREALQAITGVPVTLFAYPNGRPGDDYGPEHVAMARELGFAAALSTAWGAARHGGDLYQIPRFTPWDATFWRFALRLARNLRR